MKRKFIFFLIIILSFNISFVYSATDEGYGEANDNLGQFVDSFENSNNITVIENLIRNVTLECIELNYSTGLSYGNYSNNIQITIESDRINSNLTRFPVLIKISDNSGINDDNITGIFDEIENSYQKLAITDSSLTYEYYVDVEQWSLSDRLGALWIGVNVSSIEDIILYLHFDGEVTNNTVYVDVSGSLVAQNVWDDNFVSVYHLQDETTSTILDSTDSDLDGSKSGGNNPIEVISLMGLGQDFSNDRIDLDTYPDAYTTVTLESFFKADDTDNVHMIASLGEPDNQIDRVQMSVGSSDVIYSYFRTDGVTVNPSIAFSDEVNYHYFSITRVGTAIKGYLDGVYENGLDGVVGTGTIQDLRQTWIGSYSLGNNYYMDGIVDEVRFSNIVRSPDYFNATYYCGFDDLIKYGSLSGAEGFELEGYFITDDYLNYTTGNSLVYLTNSSIPLLTEITIQFSNDNITWVDNEGNVGFNILIDGFYSLDLRDINYTDLYSMLNFSTTDNSITSRLYQLRLVSTIGSAVIGGVVVGGINSSGILIVIFLLIIGSALLYGVSRRK